MRNVIAFNSLCMLCVLGMTFPASGQSTAVPMRNHPVEPTNWSFECQYDTDCGANGSWISTTSEPGTVRLWDSGTNWAVLENGANHYNWKNLDTWLDLLAAHQPRAAIYTFGHVPCWIANGNCTGYGWDNWSPTPPTDLAASGSASFNAFVDALVRHCSPAGNCVKDYIKYWELWNEANLTKYWTGTQAQLYEMLEPVIPKIRNNVSDAIVSTPPVCGGDAAWMAGWLALENTKGRLSDYYGFHVYLQNHPPETRMKMVQRMLATKDVNGWASTPWMNTETNFVNTTDACSPQFTMEECQGQLVRWHVLQYAYQDSAGGAFHVGWYNWQRSITSGGYDTYYYTMMQWLEGSTFITSCASDSDVWNCPLIEASGKSALIVWNAAGNSEYTPATKYVDYRKFNGTYGGTTQSITPGQVTTIGQVPIMFESHE